MLLEIVKKLNKTLQRPYFFLTAAPRMKEDGIRFLLLRQALPSEEPLPPALIRRRQIQLRVLTLYGEMVPAEFPKQMVHHMNSFVPRRKEIEMDHPAFTDPL